MVGQTLGHHHILEKIGAGGAYWSADGRWLYYSPYWNGDFCIEKIPATGGPPVRVRCQNAYIAAGVAGDSTFYFVLQLAGGGASGDFEICKARPENGPCQTLGRISSSRIPYDADFFQPVLSPDGSWLGMPLMDGATSNLWMLPADGGPVRQVTDFEQRSTLIVRRISWSPDSRYIFAAVAEPDADVVLLDGLLP